MGDERLRLWIEDIRARGLTDAARTLLDILGAMGPLAAQMIYVGQPVLRIFGPDIPLDALAEALEQPDGPQQLRTWLDEG